MSETDIGYQMFQVKHLMRCSEGVLFALRQAETDNDPYWDKSAGDWARMAATAAFKLWPTYWEHGQ